MMRWIVIVGLVLGLSASAAAQEDSMDVEAHALYEAGATAFRGGRFEDALAHFQGAYQLSHRAQLLYNIGQCQDRLRHDAEAIAAFEQYLAAMPDASQRAEIEGRLAILRAASARPTVSESPTATPTAIPTATTTATATPTATPTATATATPSPTPTPDLAPWVLVGTGAGVAIIGAILVGVAYGDIATAQNAAPGTYYSAVMDADQRAPILSGVGFAAIGVGAALAIAGVVWVTMPGDSSGATALRIGPSGLTLTGSF